VSLLRLLLVVLAGSGSAHNGLLGVEPASASPDRYLVSQINLYRRKTWHWQRLIGEPPIPAAGSELDPSHAYRRWVRDLWRQRAAEARLRASHPPHERDWLCIHGHEGAWTDPAAPYYGGLQMDIEFQREWGPDLLARKGTADNWTPLEQMWVAERARRSGLGFTPWPNTARACGLL
jgi:hypothetical protein